MRFRPSLNNPWFVAVLFLAAAIAFTWPVTATITTRNAGDLGDPLFICWVLMWTGGQALRFLHGDWHALADYWNGNIFYPEKLTLAYSEHFTGQMLQILPIYAATGNIILCYNLLFISTYVLSGLGMYLLVRELTGRPLAGVLAGVAFAFAPYRADQLAHLQVLSSQWMPLALYGFRRYFTTGRRRPLAGASAAMVMQVWSCGYYFLFFVPVAAAYVLYEMIIRRLITSRRVLIDVAAAGALPLLLILPFLLPYTQLRQEQNMGRRSISEIAVFSADTHGFISASSRLKFSTVRPPSKPENALFPGFTLIAFAIAGIAAGLWSARRKTTGAVPRAARWRLIIGSVLLLATGVLVAGFIKTAMHGAHVAQIAGLTVQLHDGTTTLIKIVVCFAGALLLLPRVRSVLAGPRGSLLSFCVAAVGVTALLMLGPVMTAGGKPFGDGPYMLLYKYAPGFDGLRVTSRYFMVTLVFLAVIAGLGAAWLITRWKRAGPAIVAMGIAAMMIEGWMAPIDVGAPLARGPHPHFDPMPFDFPSASTLNPVYARLRDEPDDSVVLEFPFGEPAFDTIAVFMAGFHRKSLVNGFSGFFPKSFGDHVVTLGWNTPTVDRDATWAALQQVGVTHVVVHEDVFFDDTGTSISTGLRAHGARELAASGNDRLFALK
jgi:hypothetical protein